MHYVCCFLSCGLNSTCFCKLFAGESRMLIAHVCAHACSMHGYRAYGHMRVPHVAIPHVAHDTLHEMCMFHTGRKHGPRKHITGIFKDLRVATSVHACKNEVIIERYRYYLAIQLVFCTFMHNILLYSIHFLDQTIFQYNVIPVQVMVAWESVAYELGFSSGDVNLIEGNAKQKPVAESSLDMLKFWMEADGRIELLIAALKRIDKNNYAEQLRVGKFYLHFFVVP